MSAACQRRGNRPIGGALVGIRSLPGGAFVSVLADGSGRFQLRGLDPGMFEIIMEEPGYEPVRETLRLNGPASPLELHVRASNPSPLRRTDYVVSASELKIPKKARGTFEKGLERLQKR